MSLMQNFFLLALCAVSPMNCLAADPRAPMAFSIYQPCSGNASFCATTILAQGVIQENSDEALEKFIARSRRELPPTPRVSFDSPGGSVSGGMKLGRLLRRLKADTIVGARYEQERFGQPLETVVASPLCASACTLAFVGGVSREVESGARFGLHQFSSVKGDLGESATQTTVVYLAAYIEEMGVDRHMLDVASMVDHTGIFWVPTASAKALNIDNTDPPLAPWTIKATNDGQPVLTLAQRTGPGKVVTVALMSDRASAHALVQVRLSKESTPRARASAFPLQLPSDVHFEVDGLRIGTQSVAPWSQEETSGEFVFQTLVSLTSTGLRRIGAAKSSLQIDDDSFPHSIWDLSPRAMLSTRDLNGGVALLLRAM